VKPRTPKRTTDVRRSAGGKGSAHDPISATPWFVRRRGWLLAAALAAAVLLAYQPAWQGGLIWDDDCHITKPELRSWHGLWRIWTDAKAAQQYYPLLHSAFWIEWQLWGDNTLGYHLVSILLHVAAAILVAIVLLRLKVPGAYLAAAIFALHPVHVESVAWITELKNTLSAVFYLSAMLVYLDFDQGRRKSSYAGAFALFVLGLMSKTVTATLPAALLVIFWWQRGRLSWRRDVLPLVLFFILGATAGLFTAWVEHAIGGAQGAEYSLTFLERCLIAGRAIWFYLGKLFWPANLTFIYPRWHVSQAVWWQYLFPLAAAALLVVLWSIRRRWRGPLAAVLFFIGTLFPVLGFFNVYPFIYSFVADHFQYLASLGIITLASAAIATLLGRTPYSSRSARGTPDQPHAEREEYALRPAYLLYGVLLVALGIRTWTQCLMYGDIQLLYQTTIERNPDCWMAYLNLGTILTDQGNVDEAIDCYQNAIKINPRDERAYLNLGAVLARQDQVDRAIERYWAALEVKPNCAEAHLFLGNAFTKKEDLATAVDEYRAALAIKPEYAEAHCNLGAALARRGQTAEAADEYRQALDVNPQYAGAHYNLADALLILGQYDEAIAEYRKAIEVKPDYVEAKQKLDFVLSHLKEIKAEIGRSKAEEKKTGL
jgi:protein O-mannosyl-transferase